MPFPYSDSAGWVLWYSESPTAARDGYERRYSHLSWATDCPPESCGTSNGRWRGVVGGDTIESALRECAAWRLSDSGRRDYENIISQGRRFMLYNIDLAETSSVDPFPPFVAPLTPDEELRKKKMIKLKFTRESGKLVLSVNATGLHETLDAIGCRTQTAGGITRYESRPHAPTLVADTAGNTLSTEIFLVKPPEGKTEITYNLSEIYNRPPSLDQLRRLARSADEKARAILEHYQPVDIQVSIQKKLIG